MKFKISKRNLLFLLVIVLLIVPQTRTPIQVLLHKGLSVFYTPTIIDADERLKVSYLNWQLQSDKGYKLKFNDTNGKVVFINFWATWCPPCIAEMPSIEALYQDYKEDVEFLFVTNDTFKITEKFKIKNNLSFEVFNSINTVPSQLKTSSIPRTFILNKNGDIVVDESHALNWNSTKVREQLDALIKA